ncbi:hypothetical protein ADM99_02640 [Leptolinea tardivitalis]|uniref:GGDEF domain-containing protein n=1 Tax=Leptolinea tardivitalis TaxID=229920 RepID=A0A0P6WSI7_9CHLR|nr:hypothetical protein ADM99_02640 [Leptolinea tardivitalis]
MYFNFISQTGLDLNYFFPPHAWFLFLTATLSLILGINTWHRRYILTGKILMYFMFSVTLWAFFSGIEAVTASLAGKIFWSKMEYFGFVWAAPLCFLLILSYTNNWKWANPSLLVVLAAISLITLILAWTNEYHNLIWDAFYTGSDKLNIIVYSHGIWFWIFNIFQFCLYCFNLVVLIDRLRFQKAPYRQQTITILVATLIPVVSGVLYIFNISPIPGLDWMPISTFFTGVIFAWSMHYYRLLDLVPIARETLVEQMLDGMIVLDDQQRIIDINPSARKMVANGENIKIGDHLADVLPELSSTISVSKSRSTTQILSYQETQDDQRFVDVRFTLLTGSKADANCSLVILRDITKRKNMEDSLNQANQELEKRIEEIQKLQHQLKEESIRDPLTNLYNRRYLMDAMQREFARARRDQYPVSIILADIDHFKRVNDTYGHLVGDGVLQQLSRILVSSFRLEDIVCRYGGEEFIIVMPDTTIETALSRIDSTRVLVESTILDISEQKVQITLSAGIAIFPDQGSDIDTVIKEADKALYRAKLEGRNRVIAGAISD